MNVIANLGAVGDSIEKMELLIARQQATLLRLIELDASPTLIETAERLLMGMAGTLAVVRSRRASAQATLDAAASEVLTATRHGMLAIWCTVDSLPWALDAPARPGRSKSAEPFSN